MAKWTTQMAQAAALQRLEGSDAISLFWYNIRNTVVKAIDGKHYWAW